MTEAEWLTATDPRPMLQYLFGKVSDRKLRLFGIACYHGIGHLSRDDVCVTALEVAERFADGAATDDERSGARRLVQLASETRATTRTPTAPKWARRAASCAYYTLAGEAAKAALATGELAVEALIWREGGHNNCDSRAIQRDEWQRQRGYLRCITGNPFQPVTADPTWRTSTVLALARQMYESRDFSATPILANALKNAGCNDYDVLKHCRGNGPHVRGCWVVDLLLGKA